MKLYGEILLALLLLWSGILNAQDSGKIENGFDTDEFPKVSFIYHSYNPEILDKSDFWSLKESGVSVDFKVKRLTQNIADSLQTTMILWEDMAYNGYNQFNFTKNVLNGFFEGIDISSSDKFAVCVFNRRNNEATVLKNLTGGFTDDKSHIVDAVNRYRHSAEYYREFPNRSDLYTAIREGLDLLTPLKGVKSIIVFTAGYPMKNSGTDSEVQVLLKAQQLHIPVYVIQYYFKSGIASESEAFAKATYGMFSSYKDSEIAKDSLISLYPEICRRYNGHDYEISFISGAKRGGDASLISLSVGGIEVNEHLLPPSYTIKSWIYDHPLWSIVLVLIVLTVITTIVLFIIKYQKTTARQQAELKAIEQRRINDKAESEQYIDRIRQEQLEKAYKAEQRRLQNLMATKNLYPCLKCNVGNTGFIYEISKPVTTIGREKDNDIVLGHDTVSRHHAVISFNGSCFEIKDIGSTNKVIVNGKFVKQTSLKAGDIIGLGSAVLTYNQ